MKGPTSAGFLVLTAFLLHGAGALAELSPDAWTLAFVLDQAVGHRPEVSAADNRVHAANARPDIVSALEDPMLSASIDHWPFGSSMSGNTRMAAGDPDPMAGPTDEPEGGSQRADWSVSLEQQFPLSRIRQHRRAAARADALGVAADSGRTRLDVQQAAATAFFMLIEQRAMSGVLDEQLHLARQLVRTAQAHYASGEGSAADVLRAELEVSRISVRADTLVAQIRAAARMLNTMLGRTPDQPVPALIEPDLLREELAVPADAVEQALSERPEIIAGRAEVQRTAAEIRVMKSMYKPMGAIRIGYASTMSEGDGVMVMFGITLPVWRTRLDSGVDEARAMSAMAKSDLGAMENMVHGEVLSASAQFESARLLRTGLRDDTLARVHALIDPALAAYASGTGTLSGAIESLTAAQMVREEFIMSGTTLGLAWVRLNRAIGRFPLHGFDAGRPANGAPAGITGAAALRSGLSGQHGVGVEW